MNNRAPLNAFTVDVEDYFQVESFSKVIDRNSWDARPCRVDANTRRILDALDTRGVKGTFFILGWIAKRYPALVSEISLRGHEVASHGMSHKLIYKQTPAEFRSETFESKKLLEDIIQKPLLGYRAATYSITNQSLWALDILAEAGYQYDSSIFPMRHDRYGIPDASPWPGYITTPSGARLVEFPISTYKTAGATIPVAGGGYFRLFPYMFTRFCLGRINKSGHEFLFYMHPWEIDENQPRIDGISRFTKFRHYNNLDKFESRMNRLLGDFRFTTMASVLNNMGLLRHNV
jgi:polysaccharide deacetylase family protein (PEP-CTERM system associated)